jgi:multiple sugar transport system substrate-binding protein
MKKILLLFVALFLVVGLYACGDDTETPIVNQKIELTYADWGNQEFNQRMIDAFMAKYPDIRVTLSRYRW